jgi:hypothetical protein
LLSPACHCKAVLRILALQVPAVESGVLSPPAHRGWCLVQAHRWGGSRAGGAVWRSQIGPISPTAGCCLLLVASVLLEVACCWCCELRVTASERVDHRSKTSRSSDVSRAACCKEERGEQEQERERECQFRTSHFTSTTTTRYSLLRRASCQHAPRPPPGCAPAGDLPRVVRYGDHHLACIVITMAMPQPIHRLQCH